MRKRERESGFTILIECNSMVSVEKRKITLQLNRNSSYHTHKSEELKINNVIASFTTNKILNRCMPMETRNGAAKGYSNLT